MLFVGDDWAEEHHDVELQDESGRVLGRVKLPEGVAGITRLHAMIGEQLGENNDEAEVVVGIETERGPWVQALIAAGYQVYAVNPLQVARYRERHGVSGAKSDTKDAHVLADMVRTDRHQLRPVAGDSTQAEAVKVLTRAHKTLIWERTRHLLRLRHALREFFPAALVAFADLTATDTLELLAAAPDPVSAAALGADTIEAALKRARRRNRAAKAQAIAAALRTEQLGQPPVVASAYAAAVRAQVAILTVLNAQIDLMEEQVEAHFGQHPDAEVYLSQPGLGVVLGARVLAEFGDDKNRYATAKARRNYAGTSPITRQSGKKTVVLARHVHNDRLVDALGLQAFAALRVSPGARAYYDQLRARGIGHRAALRQLGNRLVGILHGCLKTATKYDEDKAWPP
ncbi:MAG TPA: IS110 family transposase, partial [Rugosimonospora sp.]|nr:IS110 family transposase [Rugosimonospora sp.]